MKKAFNIQGVVEGVIVDNLDFDKTNRLKVRIPSLHGNYRLAEGNNPIGIPDDDLSWAEFSVPFYPMSMIPPIGTVVYVLFINGNLDRPVVIGCRANYKEDGSDIPSVSKDDYVNVKSIKTDKFTIDINDTDGILSVTSGSLSLVIDGDNNKIKLGSPSAVEALVKGSTFQNWFNGTFLTWAKNHFHPTGVGPSGKPMTDPDDMDALSDVSFTV